MSIDDPQTARRVLEAIQRLGNIVANLARPKGDHRQNDLEDEAHDLLRDVLRPFALAAVPVPAPYLTGINAKGTKLDLPAEPAPPAPAPEPEHALARRTVVQTLQEWIGAGKIQPDNALAAKWLNEAATEELAEARAEVNTLRAERDRLRAALVKVRAHTAYVSPDPNAVQPGEPRNLQELLEGLIRSIERIVDAALAEGQP